MLTLTTFIFTALGHGFTVEAVNAVQAFDAANQRCASMGLDLPQGAWMERARNPKAFDWTPGNFFD